jgi:hypothetical protein
MGTILAPVVEVDWMIAIQVLALGYAIRVTGPQCASVVLWYSRGDHRVLSKTINVRILGQ